MTRVPRLTGEGEFRPVATAWTLHTRTWLCCEWAFLVAELLFSWIRISHIVTIPSNTKHYSENVFRTSRSEPRSDLLTDVEGKDTASGRVQRASKPPNKQQRAVAQLQISLFFRYLLSNARRRRWNNITNRRTERRPHLWSQVSIFKLSLKPFSTHSDNWISKCESRDLAMMQARTCDWCVCVGVLSHRRWCWWWRPIGKSPGWAWPGPRWCRSPLVCPLQKHTVVSVKASVMSEQDCCATLVTLVPALLGSNRLWNYLVIGTQSTWRNHTCWTRRMGNMHTHTCFLSSVWHISQWQICSVCTDSVILMSDSADCDTQIRLRTFNVFNPWKVSHFFKNTEFCKTGAHSHEVSPHLQ